MRELGGADGDLELGVASVRVHRDQVGLEREPVRRAPHRGDLGEDLGDALHAHTAREEAVARGVPPDRPLAGLADLGDDRGPVARGRREPTGDLLPRRALQVQLDVDRVRAGGRPVGHVGRDVEIGAAACGDLHLRAAATNLQRHGVDDHPVPGGAREGHPAVGVHPDPDRVDDRRGRVVAAGDGTLDAGQSRPQGCGNPWCHLVASASSRSCLPGPNGRSQVKHDGVCPER